ncbi:class I SAM-dependent methyltransferase [Cohnella luojiensis]|uniref:Class I SAM-dependent methyltransferase n=1 Tax=Cohnella luojiensis TaxID=652876 RepID=A0A4Y8LMQ3_9BACL|nr:methyltransferase domain-containing protein [Cohnella luojiensis]TFE19376.1 class I SAM-dependent methyltransferase [Cohnella luojiensis]
MENKETFDEVALEYEKCRPTYPNEMFVDILNYSKIDKEDNILEIGCGTGQATSGLVNNGYCNITCIELGKNLAQMTSEKFHSYKSIQVINSSFEQWDGKDHCFQLAISGTAFHFIEPKFGYRKVWELLSKDGSIGFFWTIHVPSYDNLHSEIRTHYKDLAPQLDDSKLPTPEETIKERKKITEETGIFNNIIVKEYNWIQTYTSKDYISLLNTHSKHRQLSDDNRKELLDKIKNSIDSAGGLINKDQRVALFLGRNK